MVIPDDGGGGPTLNPKAKQHERELFKIFSVSTGSISLTQSDWGDAKKQLDDLAKDVRTVRGELEAPGDGSKGWTGPAASAALSTLQTLSDTLDKHAGELGAVKTSLGQVHTAVSDAKSAWYSDVSSISTYVDPDDHKRLPAPYLPTAENTANYSVRDPEAAAAAEDALWEKRNQAAKKILDQLGVDTDSAKGTMPLDVATDSETPYNNQGPASTNRTPGTATQSGNGVHPTGGTLVSTGIVKGEPVDDGTQTTPTQVNPPPEPTIEICTGYPPPVDPVVPVIDPIDVDPISSDGDTTGSTGYTSGPGTHGSTGFPTGGSTSTGGLSGGGMAAGGIGGVAGLGGMLGNRGGGGGMFSGGGSRGASGASVRGGSVSGRTGSTSTSGARGSSGMRPGGGRAGTGQMGVAGGGGRGGSGGNATRGGAGGRGSAVKGATGSGKYGVPKVGGKSPGGVAGGSAGQGGKGAAKGAGGRGAGGRGGAGTSAAGRGGARKGDKDGQIQDINSLTHEDEETWFEGTEESSPQVWE